ncbi:MAG: hypothetical protein WC376_00360 [Candidatus Nanoarchaeia archaeon]|jgi:hypothetical protein
MDNFLKNKNEIRKKYESVISERKKNYPSPFWRILEAKREIILEDNTTLDEAIKILMEIIQIIIGAAKKRFKPDKYEQINKNDISYCEQIFDDIASIWDSENIDVYEKYSDIHSLVDYSSSEVFTLKSLINDFNKIKYKYL